MDKVASVVQRKWCSSGFVDARVPKIWQKFICSSNGGGGSGSSSGSSSSSRSNNNISTTGSKGRSMTSGLVGDFDLLALPTVTPLLSMLLTIGMCVRSCVCVCVCVKDPCIVTSPSYY